MSLPVRVAAAALAAAAVLPAVPAQAIEMCRGERVIANEDMEVRHPWVYFC